MSSDNIWITKVRQARDGSEDAMNWLLREAEGRVRAYICRVTMDHDLSEDLSQETLLQMMKSINQLNDEKSFWPWLYRIAQSKIQQYYKSKKKESQVAEDTVYREFLAEREDYYQDESLRELLQQDLLKKVVIAMKQLKQQYRAVLSLRCFDNLSYTEIAETFECNETTVRVMFLRARKALKKKLANQGLGKNMMLMSLGLFGRITLSPQVPVSSGTLQIPEESIKVGPKATIIGTVFSKRTAAVLSIAAVLLLMFYGTDIFNDTGQGQIILPARNEISNLHFTVHFQDNNPGAGSLSRGAYEQWYSFPEGIDGPLNRRMQRWDPITGEKLCTWLNNEHGNYYYASGERILYQWNRRIRWSSLKVLRLPSDCAEFANFISRVEGDLPADISYTRDDKTGMLISSVDHRLYANVPDFFTKYDYNTLDEQPFIKDFPLAIKEVDQRDQMHKRGWTYFSFTGQISGNTITGFGRIPFIYDTCKQYTPWLKININNEYEIVDCNLGAYMQQINGDIIAKYPAGTFFKGLSRPWTGLHTMDAVRRDAAQQRVWFFTELSEDNADAIITLYEPENPSNTDMIYTIDVENDLVEEIIFAVGTDIKGTLEFTYLQDVDNVADKFTEPAMPENLQSDLHELNGILWLRDLPDLKPVK